MFDFSAFCHSPIAHQCEPVGKTFFQAQTATLSVCFRLRDVSDSHRLQTLLFYAVGASRNPAVRTGGKSRDKDVEH